MKKILSILTALTFASAPAFATPVKVIKTGGNRAVVEFPKGTKVQAGETLQMSSGAEEDFSPTAVGGRNNYIGLGGNMIFDLDAAEGTSALSIDTYSLQFGWNFGTFELAPTASFSKIAGAKFSWAFSLQGDLNFVKNQPGAVFVPAITAEVGVAKGINIPMQFGAVAKLFVLGKSQSAIRAGVTFDFTKYSGSSAKGISILTLGVQTYF